MNIESKDVRPEGHHFVNFPDSGHEYLPTDLEWAWGDKDVAGVPHLTPGDEVYFRNKITGQDDGPYELVRVVVFSEDRLIPPTPGAGCIAGAILKTEDGTLTMASPEIAGNLDPSLWNPDWSGDGECHVYWFQLEDGGSAHVMVKFPNQPTPSAVQ